jgi:hypothetical protein
MEHCVLFQVHPYSPRSEGVRATTRVFSGETGLEDAKAFAEENHDGHDSAEIVLVTEDDFSMEGYYDYGRPEKGWF